jgi:hypothetical protein
MDTKWIDPIVEEVRSAREKIWKECNYDLNTLFEFLKEKEKLHNQRIISENDFKNKINHNEKSLINR